MIITCLLNLCKKQYSIKNYDRALSVLATKGYKIEDGC